LSRAVEDTTPTSHDRMFNKHNLELNEGQLERKCDMFLCAAAVLLFIVVGAFIYNIHVRFLCFQFFELCPFTEELHNSVTVVEAIM
jgi:hypothetical protein